MEDMLKAQIADPEMLLLGLVKVVYTISSDSTHAIP
jgi:hypothetical protein